MDVAAITSVSNLIVVPGDESYVTFLRALPFVIIVILDIVSEVLILIYHDIPLCNQEEEIITENWSLFQAGRIIQILVQLAWIGALVYMIIVYQNLNCYDICQCTVYNSALNCTQPGCPFSCSSPYCMSPITGQCLAGSTNISIPYPEFNMDNCTLTQLHTICLNQHPSAISCVLLALILFEGIYQTVGIFFKSYLLPITLPDSILLQLYWMNNDLEKLVEKLEKNEFGFHFHKADMEHILPDKDKESDPLMKSDTSNPLL